MISSASLLVADWLACRGKCNNYRSQERCQSCLLQILNIYMRFATKPRGCIRLWHKTSESIPSCSVKPICARPPEAPKSHAEDYFVPYFSENPRSARIKQALLLSGAPDYNCLKCKLLQKPRPGELFVNKCPDLLFPTTATVQARIQKPHIAFLCLLQMPVCRSVVKQNGQIAAVLPKASLAIRQIARQTRVLPKVILANRQIAL